MTDPVPSASGGFPALPASARALAEASLSAETRRVYAGALDRLDAYLAGAALDDRALAGYLGHLFEHGRSAASAGLVVAAAKLRARLLGHVSPVGVATERVLAGFRRASRDRGRGQVVGIRWEQADAAAALAARFGGLAGLRDAAILAVASDALLRVSEVAALDVEDLTGEPDGSGRLTVRRSKTDQEGGGAVQYLAPVDPLARSRLAQRRRHLDGTSFPARAPRRTRRRLASAGAQHPQHRRGARRQCRHRRTNLRTLAAGRRRRKSRRGGRLTRRVADCRALVLAGDAGSLRAWHARRPRGRSPIPLRTDGSVGVAGVDHIRGFPIIAIGVV